MCTHAENQLTWCAASHPELSVAVTIAVESLLQATVRPYQVAAAVRRRHGCHEFGSGPSPGSARGADQKAGEKGAKPKQKTGFPDSPGRSELGCHTVREQSA